MRAHKTAIVSKKAKVAKDVTIGPYAIIEDGVKIAQGTTIGASAYLYKGTTIGKNCKIYNNATIGGEPQDLAYSQCESYVSVGDRNIIREYATIHRGTKAGTTTVVGNDNYLMALSHVAHNCHIHNNVIICNSTLLAGYVEVENRAFVSGGCVIHQFSRIGTLAMIGGGLRVTRDVPPFMLLDASNAVSAHNLVGLKRANIDPKARKQIKEAYKILYLSGLNTTNALKEIEKQHNTAEIKHLVSFIKNSKRGICGRKIQPRQKNVNSEQRHFFGNGS